MASALPEQDYRHGEHVAMPPKNYFMMLDLKTYFQRCERENISLCNETTKKFLLMMAEEMKYEGGPRASVIAECMRKTYQLRRDELVVHGLSIRNAVGIYPGLRSYVEIKNDFQRIRIRDLNVFDLNIKHLMKKNATNLLTRRATDFSNKYCSQALDIVRNEKSHHVRKAAARAILYGCVQTKENIYGNLFIVAQSGDDSPRKKLPRPQPTILVKDSPFQSKCADVYCEKVKILTGLDFYDAMFAVYYLYYVLNCEYAKMDESVFRPWDKILYGVPKADQKKQGGTS